MLLRTRFRPRLTLDSLDNRIVPAVLLVDDDGAQFPNAAFDTIQAAVDAADANDTIRVAAGFYEEQITIPEDKDGLTIRSDKPLLAVIQAPETMTGSKAIVLVDGADRVTIRGFTITGPSPDVDFGVQVTGGGSATIRDNFITAIRGETLTGAQTGIGVVVGGADGATGTADLFKNVITDYQKGGVIVANEGSSATIRDNRIVGSGETDLVAQNGIQVSDGATAVISNNTISNHVYTGDGAEAAGIVTSDAGSLVISNNRVTGNQDGLLIEGGSGVAIFNNTVLDSRLDGIVLNEVSGALVRGNRVTGSGRDGIFVVDTVNAVFVGNHVRDNDRDGLHVEGTSKNLVIFGNQLRGNDRFDAFDDTTGSGTAGTANLWFGNSIGTKSPAGLK
jgi:parallel beta-helix repeat protein